MVPLQHWEQWLKKQIIRNWVKKQILHFARINLHWEKYFCRCKEREIALRKSYGRKKSGFSSDRSKHGAVKSWHSQGGCPIVFSVKAEPVAKPCHCTLFIFLFCEKMFVPFCLCGSIISFLPAVSSFSTLSTYCYWCGLEAACLTLYPLLLTYTFRSTEMFSNFCWFCLVPLKAIMFARSRSFLWWFAVPDTSRCIYNCT